VSIAEYIGVRTTALQRRVQPPAGVHIGTQVFAVVGTNEHTATARNTTPRFAVGVRAISKRPPTDCVGYRRGFRRPGLNHDRRRTGEALGLAGPQTLLVAADQVIE